MTSAGTRLRGVAARYWGLAFDESKQGLLEEVIQRRAGAANKSAQEYVSWLEGGASEHELRALAQELTVGETYFFRHREQLQVFTQLLAARRGAAVRVLSAGCASGEEPYSLVIHGRLAGLDEAALQVVGVDLNPASLEKARHARYSRWALRETPPELRARWFEQHGNEYALHEEIRRSVHFEERNLSHENADLWAGRFDIVFCRNVLMYLTERVARAVVANIHRTLAPAGYLFLGHAETLRGLSADFHLCHSQGTFYYQHKGRAPEEAEPSARLGAEAAHDLSWVESIRLASERIRALTTSSGSGPPPTVQTDRAEQLRQALELMQEERFDAALSIVRALDGGAAMVDPDAGLLRAVLSVQRGLLDEAEQTARALLARDELDAGAHHVLALCDEARGKLASAVEHDRVACYLDPRFAMPRLHLGLMVKRMGKPAEARHDLERAVDLLLCEDTSRLLLFGGGFRRDALVALARTEVAACRGET